MNSLAELKRAIKPGVRLRCISNSYRPELNGRERLVARVQTNAFTWYDQTPHTLEIRWHPDALARCTCGSWSAELSRIDPETNQQVEARIHEAFADHRTPALRESWTTYPKAPLCRFDGSNIFDLRLHPETLDYVRLELL